MTSKVAIGSLQSRPGVSQYLALAVLSDCVASPAMLSGSAGAACVLNRRSFRG